jgi:hypothetical protein
MVRRCKHWSFGVREYPFIPVAGGLNIKQFMIIIIVFAIIASAKKTRAADSQNTPYEKIATQKNIHKKAKKTVVPFMITYPGPPLEHNPGAPIVLSSPIYMVIIIRYVINDRIKNPVEYSIPYL